MRSDGLDANARKRIEQIARRHLWWLDRLTGRMHQKLFPSDDPLRVAGENARAAMQTLHEVAKRLAEGNGGGTRQ